MMQNSPRQQGAEWSPPVILIVGIQGIWALGSKSGDGKTPTIPNGV